MKDTYDVFEAPIMNTHMIRKELKDKTIIVYGVATEYCVKAAVLGFLKRGNDVIVVSDAIMGLTLKGSVDAIKEMKNAGATYLEYEDIKQIVEDLVYSEVIFNIRTLISQYFQQYKLESVVLGISGGIDSALIAALFEPICTQYGVELIGRSLPIVTNKENEISRANEIGLSFCDNFEVVHLGPVFHVVSANMEKTKETESELDTKIRQGNIKARIRMIYLYDLARANNGMVLSTDNLTENQLGFWTLHGDVGDYSAIQNLTKDEVYIMSRVLRDQLELDEEFDQAEALDDCIDAIPTDGLGITNSDLDQIGCDSYSEVCDILYRYIEKSEYSLEDHPVIQRYLRTTFKRENPLELSRTQIGMPPL